MFGHLRISAIVAGLPLPGASGFAAYPDKAMVAMSSAGTGSNTHLTGELFQFMAKVKFLRVPYKGSGAALVDLVGGQVRLMFDQVSASGPHIKAGKLRGLAVTTLKRSSVFPGVPPVQSPEDFVVIVVGGAGKHSAFIPTFGTTRPITRAPVRADGQFVRSVEDLRRR